jgi:leader peptidase (prepilin peptidase)/N-methyltransferase
VAVGLAALAFLPGLAVGSFLNVVAARIPVRRSIVSPPSACLACGTQLKWYDNIPVLSYLALRGRCRTCRAPIGWKYPLVELTTAVLVSACVLRMGATAHAAIACFFCATLVALSVTDLERRIIPNRIVLPAAAVVLVAQTAIDRSAVWAIAAVAGALFFLLAALAYPGGMGMGDVKLVLLLGAMLGSALPVGLMIGLIAALVPSFVLMARHGGGARKMAIPLAPFLAFGGLIALFAGSPIIHSYLKLG